MSSQQLIDPILQDSFLSFHATHQDNDHNRQPQADHHAHQSSSLQSAETYGFQIPLSLTASHASPSLHGHQISAHAATSQSQAARPAGKRKADEIDLSQKPSQAANAPTLALNPGAVLPPKKKRGRPAKPQSQPEISPSQDPEPSQPTFSSTLPMHTITLPNGIPFSMQKYMGDTSTLNPALSDYAYPSQVTGMDSYLNNDHPLYAHEDAVASTSTLPTMSHSQATSIADAVHQAILPVFPLADQHSSVQPIQTLLNPPAVNNTIQRTGRSCKKTDITEAERNRMNKQIYDGTTGARKSDADILTAKHWSAADLRLLRDHFGVVFESGKRFTDTETATIKQTLDNKRRELQLAPDDDAGLRKALYTKPLDLKGFWLPLTRSLPGRPMNTLFLHIGVMLSNRKTEDWTPEQDRQIIALVKEHGKKWKKISSLMDDISPSDIANHYFTTLNVVDVDNRKSGVFSEQEIVSLVNAVEEAKISIGPTTKRGFWDKVAKSVPLRTPNQCKQKWAAMISVTPGSRNGSM